MLTRTRFYRVIIRLFYEIFLKACFIQRTVVWRLKNNKNMEVSCKLRDNVKPHSGCSLSRLGAKAITFRKIRNKIKVNLIWIWSMQGYGRIIITLIIIIIIIIIIFSQLSSLTTITNFNRKTKLNLNTVINSHPAYPSCVPPINPAPRRYLRVTWSSVHLVMWKASWHSLEDYNDTRWLTGLWFTEAKVEGLLKAAWHYGSDSSVVNDWLGEPGRTTLYVGFPSAWGSVDGDHNFSPSFVGKFLNWGPWRLCKWRLWKQASFFIWTRWGTSEGTLVYGEFS